MSSSPGESPLLDAALASAAALLGFAFLYYPMASTPLVPGIDGPYYVVQAEYLLAHGRLKYPDPPLAFCVIALAAFLSKDLFAAVEFSSALVTALSAVPTYFLTKKLAGSRIAGFAAGLALVVNPFTLRLASDFVKNSMGMLWLALFLYYDLSYASSGRRRDLLALTASLTLAALTHVLDYGLALAYAVSIFALAPREQRRRAALGALVAMLTVLVFAAIPAAVGGDIRKAYAFLKELSEGAEEVGAFGLERYALPVGISISLAIGALLSKGRPLLSTLLASSAIVASALNFPLIPSKWLFRFSLMTPVPLAHCIGAAVAARRGARELQISLLLLAFLLAAGLGAYRMVRPSIPPPAYAELEKALAEIEEMGLKAVVPDVRLRYWAETLSEEIYGRGQDVGAPCAVVALRTSPRVPRGIPVFEGRYVVAAIPRSPSP